jgi:hypothetical protein
MDYVINLGKDLFKKIFGDVDTDKLQTQIVKGIIYAEYAIRNFGKASEVVWAGFEYLEQRAINTFIYYFTEGIPAAIKWFADNWDKVWTLAYDVATKVALNTAKAIVGVFLKVDWDTAWSMMVRTFEPWSLKLVRASYKTVTQMGRAAFGDPDAQEKLQDWWDSTWKDSLTAKTPDEAIKDAVKGVKEIMSKLGKNEYGFGKFNMPVRVVPEAESKLWEEFKNKKDKFDESFPEFYMRRLKEMRDSGEIEEEGEKTGDALGAGLNKGLDKQVKKFDNVLFGSAEHLRRIAEATAAYGAAPRQSVVGQADKYKEGAAGMAGSGGDWKDATFARNMADTGGGSWTVAANAQDSSSNTGWTVRRKGTNETFGSMSKEEAEHLLDSLPLDSDGQEKFEVVRSGSKAAPRGGRGDFENHDPGGGGIFAPGGDTGGDFKPTQTSTMSELQGKFGPPPGLSGSNMDVDKRVNKSDSRGGDTEEILRGILGFIKELVTLAKDPGQGNTTTASVLKFTRAELED